MELNDSPENHTREYSLVQVHEPLLTNRHVFEKGSPGLKLVPSEMVTSIEGFPAEDRLQGSAVLLGEKGAG